MQAPLTKSAESASDRIVHWRAFFNIGLRVLGVGLLASGIVSWIAANWDAMSKFERIAGVQGLLVAVVAIALILAWRQYRKYHVTDHSTARHAGGGLQPGRASHAAVGTGLPADTTGVAGVPAFAGALFLACVVTGGLLALLGQTYQTGADPWTLFGWWALLIVPWLWASRSWFVVVLWLVVLNTAVLLLFGQRLLLDPGWDSPASYAWAVAGLNAALLAAAERLRRRYSDPYRVVPRLLVLATLVALFCTLAVYLESALFRGQGQSMMLQGIFVAAVVALGFHVYRRIRPDIFILSQLAVFTVLYAGTYMLVVSWLFAESITLSVALAFFIALGGMLGCVAWLRKVHQALAEPDSGGAAVGVHHAERPDVPLVGKGAVHVAPEPGLKPEAGGGEPGLQSTAARRSPLLFLFSFAFLFLLGTALILILEIPLTVAGGICLVAGLLAYFAIGGKWQVTGATLMLVSLLFLAFEVFDLPQVMSGQGTLLVLGLVAGLMILYHLYQIPWFQFLCAVAALVMLALLWPQYSPGLAMSGSSIDSVSFGYDSGWSFFLNELAPIYIVLATVIMMSLPATWARRYKSLAWALLCIPLCSYGFHMFGLLSGLSSQSGMGEPGSQSLLVLALENWRLPTRFPLVYASNLIFALLPVVVAWLSARRRQVPMADQAVVLIVLLVLGALWGNLPGVQLGLLFCLLGQALRDRRMLVVGVVSVIIFLAQFYFQLYFLLLDKAYYLIGQGAALLLVALAWYWWRPVQGVRQVPAGAFDDPQGRGVPSSATYATPYEATVADRYEANAPMPSPALVTKRAGRHYPRLAPVATAIVAGLVAVLALANVDIVQKEAIIRDGTRFVVALLPVDPRSLMQGDYMTLNFASRGADDGDVFSDQAHQYVELAPDAQGVFHFTRTLPQMGPPARPDNVVVRYRRQMSGTVLFVTDAYFFPEGKGEHFALARYGEFRVNEKGVALLVGLLDEKLNRL